MITTKNYSFRSKDGVDIKGVCMIPEKPIAILQMVHGMNEHKERYFSFMEEMAGRGYITLMHDNRGHGESIADADDLGFCYANKDVGLVNDIHLANRYIRKEYPELPLILYGHSMGSLAARAFLKNHDDEIDGLILSGCPGYNSAVPFGKLLVLAMEKLKGERYRSGLVQGMAVGAFNKAFAAEEMENAWLSIDSSVSEAFNNDPLCQFTYTLNGFETLLNLELTVYRDNKYYVNNPELPIFFFSGKDDPCYISMGKWESAIKHMESLGYKNVTATMFENMRHEIHNEKERLHVFDEYDKCIRYCVKRLQA